MLTSTTIHTAHGYAIRVRRVGIEVELVTSSTAGVISTVRMSENEARALLAELDSETGYELSGNAYDDGYAAGQEAAA